MTAVQIIERAINSKVLAVDLCHVPNEGATDEEIQLVQTMLGTSLSDEHRALVRRWKCLDLEVVRIYGCGQHCPQRLRLTTQQATAAKLPTPSLVIGSDPAGFMYLQDHDEYIWVFDTDGENHRRIAESLSDFFNRIVFGRDAAEFFGDDWLVELKTVGLVD